jgi:hypothetical protein
MSYLLLIFYLLFFLWLIKQVPFFKSPLFTYKWIAGVFILKFLAGIALYLVYARFYGNRMSGDIFKYFDDGNIIYSALRQNPADYFRMLSGIGSDSPHLMQYYDTCHFWIKEFNYGLVNDNRIVIRFNALVRLISMGNIHIHTLIMSFLSFTGLWFIFKLFESDFKDKKWGLLLAVFFFPSVLFWTSGLLKEGILIFAFGMLLYFWNHLFETNKRAKPLLFIALSIFILIFSKFYVLLAAAPGLLLLLVAHKRKNRKVIIHFIWVHILVFLLFWFSEPIFGFNLPEILADKQNDFINFVNSLNQAGSKIAMDKLDSSFWSFAKAAPLAFFTTLCRPSIFEMHNLTSAMAAFENLIIVLLIIFTVFYFNRKHISNPKLWFSISFAVILFTLSGLSTPILGALVRYKAPALPFLGIIILYLTRNFSVSKFKIKSIFTNKNFTKNI